jgi:hypothetical protein
LATGKQKEPAVQSLSHRQRNYICNICKTQIIFRKSALLFFAVLAVRRYFGGINGNE